MSHSSILTRCNFYIYTLTLVLPAELTTYITVLANKYKASPAIIIFPSLAGSPVYLFARYW